MNWIARIDQDRNFRGGRNHFPQYFYHFAGEPRYDGRKTRYVAARTRQALDEADPDGIGHSHEYNRNAGGCRFQGYGCLWVGGDEHIGAESYQLGGESWQAILGVGITILDDQVSSIDPAVVSQAVKQRFLNGRLHLIMARKPSRRRVPCARERRGETSSAAVAAMNSRRFIRSSRSLRTTGRRVSRLDCGRTHCGCKCCVANAARGARRLWVKPGKALCEHMFSAVHRIVLQNSKVAAVQIFGENLKRKEVDDSHSFSRATEVAHEFGARR